MTCKIRIAFGNQMGAGILFDSEAGHQIAAQLPINTNINLWGDEIYFPIHGKVTVSSPQVVVEAGDLAFWPDGNCFCIFYGPTPASNGSEIRAASPVQVFGRITSDLGIFQQSSRVGDAISISRSEE